MRSARRQRFFPAAAPAVLLAVGLLTGCGGGSGVCSELREPEGPQSGLHVIGDDVSYQTDPPTSGPHWAIEAPTGLQQAILPLPVQVRILESGGVLVQSADAGALAELAPLAESAKLPEDGLGSSLGDWLVIAPGPDDLDSLVVATAWTWKLQCTAVDLDAIRAFAEQRRHAAPGPD